jgi:hypothetical protein
MPYIRSIIAATICLTIAVLLGSAGTSWGSDDTSFQEIKFQDGADAYESRAISESLTEHIIGSFELFFTDSHFPYGPYCEDKKKGSCRQNLEYKLEFKTASIDLDGDRVNEVIVKIIGPNECGSLGCTSYILKNYSEGWKTIGMIFPEGVWEASSFYKNGMRTIKLHGRSKTLLCVFEREEYECS